MMKAKLCKQDPDMNMALRSGATTAGDKGKQPKEDTWVFMASAKQPEFDLEHVKEPFTEAKRSFMEASTSGSKDQVELEMDPSMLTTI